MKIACFMINLDLHVVKVQFVSYICMDAGDPIIKRRLESH